MVQDFNSEVASCGASPMQVVDGYRVGAASHPLPGLHSEDGAKRPAHRLVLTSPDTERVDNTHTLNVKDTSRVQSLSAAASSKYVFPPRDTGHTMGIA